MHQMEDRFPQDLVCQNAVLQQPDTLLLLTSRQMHSVCLQNEKLAGMIWGGEGGKGGQGGHGAATTAMLCCGRWRAGVLACVLCRANHEHPSHRLGKPLMPPSRLVEGGLRDAAAHEP